MTVQRDAYDIAVELDALGFCVLPAQHKSKRPWLDWKKYQTRRSTDDLLELFGFDQQYSFWLLMGSQSGAVVLDCDNEAAVNYWKTRLEKVGVDIWQTAWVKTAKGYHLYWKLSSGQGFESWSQHGEKDEEPSFDVRGDGTGVIAPPSVHVTGVEYTWGRTWDHALPVPQELYKPGSSRVATGASNGVATTTVGRRRSSLADLLRKPPKKEGGRNIWLTAVAGHYAKQIHYRDGFDASVEMANQRMTMPLDDEEVQKIEESIWGSEIAKPEVPSAENGYLVAGPSHQLMTLVRVKDAEHPDGYSMQLQPWADFDIQAQGVIVDERGNRSFVVVLLKEGEPPQRELLVPETLGVPLKLNVWLIAHGCTVMPPVGDPRRGLRSERIHRYLESQEPPEFQGVGHLGWHAGIGFIVHEGIIDAEQGLLPHEGVMPHPRLRGDLAPYRYGFVEPSEARAVLRELLTFHEPDVACVYLSWWCANILKGQPGFGAAHWPSMAIIAPSEAGKTRGIFALVNMVFGYAGGSGESTLAAARDALASHRNGLVWADDLDDPTAFMALVRQATSEGSKSKKGLDRTSTETVHLVNNVCVTGESLGAILAEKAQRDRAIQLEVGSPVKRISKHGDYSQWDDIESLLNRYGRDLTKIAGTVVQMTLQRSEMAGQFRELRGAGGRHNDKIGVLRVGARVLASITENPRIVVRVDHWCETQQDLGAENVLTTLVLPQLLAARNMPTSAFDAPPAFVREGIVWVHVQKTVVEWPKLHRMGERARDLVSEASVRAQLKALSTIAVPKAWQIAPRLQREAPKQARYYPLSEEVSRSVLARTEMILG